MKTTLNHEIEKKLILLKLLVGIILILFGIIQGLLMVLDTQNPAISENHYTYVSSYSENAVLVASYQPIYAGICIISGVALLLFIKQD